jgi:hypothetical protein
MGDTFCPILAAIEEHGVANYRLASRLAAASP